MVRDKCPAFEHQPQHILLSDRKPNYWEPVENQKIYTAILGVVERGWTRF